MQERQVEDDQSVTTSDSEEAERANVRDPGAWRKLAAMLGVAFVMFSPACTANVDTDDEVESEDDADVDLDDDVDDEEDEDLDVEVDE